MYDDLSSILSHNSKTGDSGGAGTTPVRDIARRNKMKKVLYMTVPPLAH